MLPQVEPYDPNPNRIQASRRIPSSQLRCCAQHLEQTLRPSACPSSTNNNVTKKEFAVRLVDRATEALCSIWHSSDVPVVSLTVTATTAASRTTDQTPVDSSSRISPHDLSSSLTQHTVANQSESQQNMCGPVVLQINFLPIKQFVHEILRRSRISGEVLHTALCYLEVLRPKIPHLLEIEKESKGARGEPQNLRSRISRTVSHIDHPEVGLTVDEGPNHPSPLLCPRRTFIAALILASKFTQEQSYSNRAWAKLSGLPIEEIGRCERNLCNALEWRLWVIDRHLNCSYG